MEKDEQTMDDIVLCPSVEEIVPSDCSSRALSTTTNQVADSLRSLENMACTVTTNIRDIVSIRANVEIQLKQLDTQLNLAMLNAKKDAQLYEMSLPMWERQLDQIQHRLDVVMDKVLSMADESFSEGTLKKQSLMMDLLTTSSTQFNQIVAKLLTR